MRLFHGGTVRFLWSLVVLAAVSQSSRAARLGHKPLWLFRRTEPAIVKAVDTTSRADRTHTEEEEIVLTKIAFGSCNNQSSPTLIWNAIVKFQPELFIWLGDNIYADIKLPTRFVGPNRNAGPWKIKPRFLSVGREEVEENYRRVKEHPGYAELRKSAKVIGTWDDHDYGLNDAGREYAGKWMSQELALDFLDEPKDSPRRKQEGIYAAYTHGPRGKRVKVFLLDLRFHRQPIGSDGDLLGESQWAWLEREVRSSDAQVNIFGSSVQVLSNLTATVSPLFSVESWARFPSARERFFDLLASAKLGGVIFLSGDIHFGEIMRYDCSRLQYPLFEVTSSGLSQSVEGSYGFPASFFVRAAAYVMPNTMRFYGGECRTPSCTYGRYNFGTLEIDWGAKPVMINATIRDEWGESVIHVRIPLSQLQVGHLARQPPLASGEIRRHCSLESELPWHLRKLLPLVFFFLISLGALVLMLPCCFGLQCFYKLIRTPKRKPD